MEKTLDLDCLNFFLLRMFTALDELLELDSRPIEHTYESFLISHETILNWKFYFAAFSMNYKNNGIEFGYGYMDILEEFDGISSGRSALKLECNSYLAVGLLTRLSMVRFYTRLHSHLKRRK